MRWLTPLLLVLSFIQSEAQVTNLLIARNTGKYPIWNGDTIAVFGFTQALKEEVKVPGPTLYYNQGVSATIDLWNVSQGAPHTIHLHGLDVDQANDGVPHLSFDVGHMDHGYYNFVAPHAGTYLYHCHVVSTIHVQAGMYGLIIVRPSDGSFTTWSGGHRYDREAAWMTSELDTNWHKKDVLDHPHDTNMAIMTIKIPEYHPQHFLINGLSNQQLSDSTTALKSAIGETVYLRLANIGYYGNLIRFPSSYGAKIVSSDGRPLPTAELSDSLSIFPGERYGLLLKSNSSINDSISIAYFDLNTLQNKNTQWIPAKVDGYVSTEQHRTPQMDLFPNPAQDWVNIVGDDIAPTDWYALNVMGKRIPLEIIAVTESHLRLQLKELPAGIYSIQSNQKGVLSGWTILKL